MSAPTAKEPKAKPSRKIAAKPVSVAVAPAVADASATPAALRLKELVDRVVASTGGKKKGVKEVVEATLSQLGLALQNGEALNLPDFGRVRIAKAQGATPGSAMTLKLRRNVAPGKKKPEPAAELALAAPADQG